jgi:hypothetical protein
MKIGKSAGASAQNARYASLFVVAIARF